MILDLDLTAARDMITDRMGVAYWRDDRALRAASLYLKKGLVQIL